MMQGMKALVVLSIASAAAAFQGAALPLRAVRTTSSQPAMRSSLDSAAPSSLRRSFLLAAGVSVAGQMIATPQHVLAFENRVAAKGKYPPSPGAKAKGVGDGPKDGQLKFCSGQPNCFTSSPLEEDAEHAFPPFEYQGMNKEAAMETLMQVVNAYKPGQGDIDTGGFKVVKTSPDYIYVQFESGKKGYVDDFELALVDDGKVLVRSSSRLGYLDFGVNAKRINYFADRLNEYEGWKCSKISKASHPDYVAQNAGKQRDIPQQGTWLTE
mmetsp:Transcript_63850/g.93491  ORF Transcript_63850/g.93491 Transcript_63850/m.93491 type:complete len:268 (-) Transcript_63850:425-1228(-)